MINTGRQIYGFSIGLALLVLAAGAAPPWAAPHAGAAGRVSPRLQEVAEAAGIDFVHQHSPTPEKHYVESAPGGLAVFDYNGDGRPDIFFTNGAATPSLEKTSAAFANRLYRNDGDMRFTDVTESAGVQGTGYATGAAAADYDKDGQLDLLVVNYVQWSPEGSRFCGDQSRGIRIYCHPRFFQGLPNRLYRNRGDGTFEDVSDRAGLSKHVGKGMSVAFADYDQDGWLDVFVTNDTVPNFLFRNNGDGTFRETGLLAGVALPVSGRPVSAMGTDFQDYDNDGWADIHFTALSGETFPLFRNDRRGGFEETTQSSRLATMTMKLAGWCSVFADVDNDGHKDIFTANSHANDRIGEFQAIGWKQPNSLFLNEGQGRFRDATAEAGLDAAVAVHRGCGIADFDGDGRLDITVLVLGSRAELWKNVTSADHGWLIVRLRGTTSTRDGIGARVTVGNQVRTMSTALGYASSSHAGMHFGLGAAMGPVRVEVQWPSGVRQTLENVKVNQVLEITEQAR